jgi:hypothetical protein
MLYVLCRILTTASALKKILAGSECVHKQVYLVSCVVLRVYTQFVVSHAQCFAPVHSTG